MSMSDSAEYWWAVKNKKPYNGPTYRHATTLTGKCSHFRPQTGNTLTTPYIEDVNCRECKAMIEAGQIEGLKEGKAPETFYMSNSGKKRFNERKRFDEQYGKCSCGSRWQIRKNKSNGNYFLGCSDFPKCKNTKSIKTV